KDPPVDPPEVPMADNRTMAELFQAPTQGYEDAIVIPEIAANNFELRHCLINLVQNKQFFGHDKEDCTLISARPHHGFSELHQLDTFYNAININDQDLLNSAAGGNFLDKMPRECLKIIESKSKVLQSRAKAVIAKVGTSSSTPAISLEVSELKDMVRALLLDKKNQSSAPAQSSTPTPVKAIEPGCVTCGGTHSYQNYPATSGNDYRDNIQERDNERRRDQANKQIEKFYEIFKEEKLSEMARTLMNEHCSVVILNKLPRKLRDPGKLLIPCEFSGMDECLALADLGASINLMSLFVWKGLSLLELTLTCMTLELADRLVSKPIGIAKDIFVKVGVFHFPADFVVVDFEPDPRVPLILERCFLKMGRALIDVQRSHHLQFGSHFLGFSDVTASGNPTPYDDPIVSTTSPILTLFGDSDFLLFEEAYPDSPKINPFYYDPEGDILLLEDILNSKPLPSLPNHKQYMPSYKKELKVCEAKTVKFFVNEPLKVELKDLPPHLEYAFLEGDNKLPIIITKELGDEEKSALIKVLKSHKQAIAWKLSDIQGINLEFCTHKILIEEDYKLAVQHQRRVNPKIHEVIKKEVEKLLDAGLIYSISNSPWVSPMMKVFMDDFSVFGNSFENCLSRLDKMLQRCEDTNLSLNWEKSHFMVKESIVIGHKISRNEIEVDRAKVDFIAKLPHPTTVKDIRSFLGHAGFYRRFIQDFFKISRPMTHLLKKNTPFIFSKDCIKAFQTLKKKLTEAPIFISPNWDLPFELMCDTNDFTISAVLGQ
nr:hypothetical protein [Tanacetum cinerariifolium]